MTQSTTVIGWNFDDTDNPDAWGHAGTALLGFSATLKICWEQWHNWKADTRGDGSDARQQLTDCARALRRVQPQDRNALDEIIGEFALLDGCDDFRGAAYYEEQSDRGADTWREEQSRIDSGQAHRERIPCGCEDYPCCGCEDHILVGGAA